MSRGPKKTWDSVILSELYKMTLIVPIATSVNRLWQKLAELLLSLFYYTSFGR